MECMILGTWGFLKDFVVGALNINGGPQVPRRHLTVFSRFANGMYDFVNSGQFLERFCS